MPEVTRALFRLAIALIAMAGLSPARAEEESHKEDKEEKKMKM